MYLNKNATSRPLSLEQEKIFVRSLLFYHYPFPITVTGFGKFCF